MTQIKLLRVTGITEGISFLVLLLIAMPLKYYAGFPLAVKIVGWAHGVLFIAYIVAVFAAFRVMKWNLWNFLLAIGASLIPFGTFVLDKSWRAREKALAA